MIGQAADLTTGSVVGAVAVGAGALTGPNSVSMGYQALNLANTSMTDNTVIGHQASKASTSGSFNVVIGTGAAPAMTTGSSNVFIGAAAGDIFTSASNVVCIGRSTGGTGQTGGNSVVIGTDAGISGNGSGSAVAIGYGSLVTSGAVAIGNNASATGLNSVAIGNGVSTASSDTIVLGTSSHATSIPGSLTVGVTATIKDAVVTMNSTSTTAGNGNGAIRVRNTSAIANNWADIQFESATPNKVAIIGAKITNHASSYGELWFHSRSSAALHPRLRLPETGGMDVYGNAGTAVLTVSNTGDLAPVAAAGIRFGTANTQKLAFFGATPVVQPAATPAAATDEATTQALVNDIRTKLMALGLIA